MIGKIDFLDIQSTILKRWHRIFSQIDILNTGLTATLEACNSIANNLI